MLRAAIVEESKEHEEDSASEVDPGQLAYDFKHLTVPETCHIPGLKDVKRTVTEGPSQSVSNTEDLNLTKRTFDSKDFNYYKEEGSPGPEAGRPSTVLSRKSVTS